MEGYPSFMRMLSDDETSHQALEEFMRMLSENKNSSQEPWQLPVKDENSAAVPCTSSPPRLRSRSGNLSTEHSPIQPLVPDSTRPRRRRRKSLEVPVDNGCQPAAADTSHRRRRRDRELDSQEAEWAVSNKVTVLEGKCGGRCPRLGEFQCLCPRCLSSTTTCIPFFHSGGGSLTHCQRPPDPPGEALKVPARLYAASSASILRALSPSGQAAGNVPGQVNVQ